MTTARFRVRGDVQGVGFRAFAARVARAAGVSGGVRNERDGSVTAVASGDEAAVASFAGSLAEGPRYGRVDAIEREELSAPPAKERFDLEF